MCKSHECESVSQRLSELLRFLQYCTSASTDLLSHRECSEQGVICVFVIGYGRLVATLPSMRWGSVTTRDSGSCDLVSVPREYAKLVHLLFRV